MPAAFAMAEQHCETHAIPVDGGVLSVVTAGRGFPLILLHGWTLDNRMWARQAAALSDHYRLIMPDRRGFGRSTAPPDLTKEAADVLRLADAFGASRFGLVGLSQGAAVALDCALHYPDRVTGVALAGTPLPGLVPHPDTPPRDDYVVLIRRGDHAEMRRQWLRHPLMHMENPALAAELADLVAGYEGRDLISPSALPVFSQSAIARLPMPLLALVGDKESDWRIACATLLAETAPLGAFASIRDAGHMVNLEQDDAFNAALLRFFARVPSDN
jgi:pimeloyl-ACP methyl ester carboxylesterase